MLRIIPTISALVTMTIAADSQETIFSRIIKTPGAVDSLTQEITLKTLSAHLCKIEDTLPKADIMVLMTALENADPEAAKHGKLVANLSLQGLPIKMKPGTEQCRMVERSIKEAIPLYHTLATAATDPR